MRGRIVKSGLFYILTIIVMPYTLKLALYLFIASLLSWGIVVLGPQ
jgi:hypothetical protein